jgi:DnaJ-class molecular chaperone
MCDGEGIMFWSVDVWHADQCSKCKGTGTVLVGRNF